MRLLLLSNSSNPDQGFLEHAETWIKEHFTGATRILFIPYALKDQNQYAEKAKKAFLKMGFELVSAHTSENPVSLLNDVQGIFIGGGQTFRLLQKLKETGLFKAIQEKVGAGMPYMGSSAGTNVACPSIRTTNDMPILELSNLKALGLVPFQINPHYLDPMPESKHMGETREERLLQFHEENDLPVIGIREGTALKIMDKTIELLGTKSARIFIKNTTPREIEWASDLSAALPTIESPISQSGQDLRTLYPESLYKLREEYFLSVGPADEKVDHELYIAEYGNPKGTPVVVLHGGPGAGCSPKYARFFDPEQYRIILFDQRGAGKSIPKYCMKNNTSPLLVNDIEQIRELLEIDQWAVFGGSWGSTLALLYAEAHPERVLGLILRGIWLAREDEVYGYLRADKPGPKMKPEKWRAFKRGIEALCKEAGMELTPKYDMIDVLYDLITTTSESIKTRTASLVAKWEFTVCFFNEPSDADLEKWSKEDYGIGMATAEITYKKFRCFIKENQILNDLDKLKGIPVWIDHGKDDLCTPADQALDLVERFEEIGSPVQAFYRPTQTGHTAMEPGNTDALVRSADALLKHLLLQKMIKENKAANINGSLQTLVQQLNKREDAQTNVETLSLNSTPSTRAF